MALLFAGQGTQSVGMAENLLSSQAIQVRVGILGQDQGLRFRVIVMVRLRVNE